MLSTKNTNCDSFPELELAHQKQEWCHKFIAKSTRRNWALDFKDFYCQPAPESHQSHMHDTVQMRSPQTLSFCSLWGVWERQRGSRLQPLNAGLRTTTSLSNFLLCAGLHRMVNQPQQTLMLDDSSILNPYSARSSLIQSVGIECDAYFQWPPQTHKAPSVTSKSKMHTTQANFLLKLKRRFLVLPYRIHLSSCASCSGS